MEIPFRGQLRGAVSASGTLASLGGWRGLSCAKIVGLIISQRIECKKKPSDIGDGSLPDCAARIAVVSEACGMLANCVAEIPTTCPQQGAWMQLVEKEKDFVSDYVRNLMDVAYSAPIALLEQTATLMSENQEEVTHFFTEVGGPPPDERIPKGGNGKAKAAKDVAAAVGKIEAGLVQLTKTRMMQDMKNHWKQFQVKRDNATKALQELDAVSVNLSSDDEPMPSQIFQRTAGGRSFATFHQKVRIAV